MRARRYHFPKNDTKMDRQAHKKAQTVHPIFTLTLHPLRFSPPDVSKKLRRPHTFMLAHFANGV